MTWNIVAQRFLSDTEAGEVVTSIVFLSVIRGAMCRVSLSMAMPTEKQRLLAKYKLADMNARQRARYRERKRLEEESQCYHRPRSLPRRPEKKLIVDQQSIILEVGANRGGRIPRSGLPPKEGQKCIHSRRSTGEVGDALSRRIPEKELDLEGSVLVHLRPLRGDIQKRYQQKGRETGPDAVAAVAESRRLRTTNEALVSEISDLELSCSGRT